MHVLFGSNGNITSKISALLLKYGSQVRVVGRGSKSLAALKAAGAQIATGDLGDSAFLSQAFAAPRPPTR